ncbi:hypothetical protein MBM_05423 [Drepanopeziza brunnea f. sp. 'multigermtubi' MB_m1]|uniref:Uncharacterized protein n=1 Tax=Marssonina brunnea f. sp. multigermtubi (strain MB_m1) TaxID=1072389 RepID=K1XU40_MARBU|nr:uncharacterized protein MBM_05423 [Drepanopeziza brunnea f. sp. 'multigermtubi' MB_m1]EKD16129.1 hypothetical protein MBM_05423 [Drepanopeziza brunnea f. sp. 'multigermtubi' MB_m1]
MIIALMGLGLGLGLAMAWLTQTFHASYLVPSMPAPRLLRLPRSGSRAAGMTTGTSSAYSRATTIEDVTGRSLGERCMLRSARARSMRTSDPAVPSAERVRTALATFHQQHRRCRLWGKVDVVLYVSCEYRAASLRRDFQKRSASRPRTSSTRNRRGDCRRPASCVAANGGILVLESELAAKRSRPTLPLPPPQTCDRFTVSDT